MRSTNVTTRAVSSGLPNSAEPSCAVLVLSCARYADLWRPCTALLRQHWPDCPWAVYIGTDGGEVPLPQIRFLVCEPDLPWSDCVLAHLRRLDHDYVLLMLEDFFLRDRVDTAKVCAAVRQISALRGVCLRLIPRPGPARRDAIPGYPGIGRLGIGAEYRVSTQAALWQRTALCDLLQSGESAWEFENQASLRSNRLFPDGFYGVYRSLFPYRHHVVERGKWFPWDAYSFGKKNIGCDFSRRPIMSLTETARFRNFAGKLEGRAGGKWPGLEENSSTNHISGLAVRRDCIRAMAIVSALECMPGPIAGKQSAGR